MKIKYQKLLNKPLNSRLSKSKYLHVYLYFLEFQNPSEIPFDEIARLTKEDPVSVRALMRSAIHNMSIAEALIDIGVQPEDLPSWMKMSKSVKRSRSKANNQTRASAQRNETSPALANVLSNPLEKINLPPTLGYSQVYEPQTSNLYDDNVPQDYMSPAETELWTMFVAKLREEDLREKKHWEEIRRIEERAKRPLTLDEFKTLSEMIQLYRDVEVQGLWDEYRYWKSVVDFKAANDRAAFEKDRDEALQLAEETMGNIATAFNEMRPTRVTVKIIPLLPPNREDQYQELRELNRQKEEEKTKDLMAIAEFTRDQRKKNRATKMYRHGSLLRPQKVYYLPGHKPVKLLDGPRGERINKLLNLDHLREIE